MNLRKLFNFQNLPYIVIAIFLIAFIVYAGYIGFATLQFNQPTDTDVSAPIVDKHVISKDERTSYYIFPEIISLSGSTSQTLPANGEVHNPPLFIYPKLKNVENTEVKAKLEQSLAPTEEQKADLKLFEGVPLLVGDYEISFENDKIVSLVQTLTSNGAYSTTYKISKNLDINTGSLVQANDLALENKFSELLGKANKVLAFNISKRALELENVDYGKAALEQYFNNASYKFTQDNINNFYITKEGITFIYSFNFPHVVKAAEPESEIFVSFEDLKDIVDKNKWGL